MATDRLQKIDVPGFTLADYRKGPALERLKIVVQAYNTMTLALVENNNFLVEKLPEFQSDQERDAKKLKDELQGLEDANNRSFERLNKRIIFLELPIHKRIWRKLRRRKQ